MYGGRGTSVVTGGGITGGGLAFTGAPIAALLVVAITALMVGLLALHGGRAGRHRA